MLRVGNDIAAVHLGATVMAKFWVPRSDELSGIRCYRCPSWCHRNCQAACVQDNLREVQVLLQGIDIQSYPFHSNANQPVHH